MLGLLIYVDRLREDQVLRPLTESDYVSMRKLLGHFGPDTLLLADRGFCSYEIIARLLGNGCHSLMRLHQRREKGFTLRKGKRIGSNERLVTWVKPARTPKTTDLSDAEWDQLPDTMESAMKAREFDSFGACNRSAVERPVSSGQSKITNRQSPSKSCMQRFGSAPVEAFEEFLDALRDSGATKVEIG